jgi:hypothetical protein
MSGCPIFKGYILIPRSVAASANGTSFLTGEEGIDAPFLDICGMFLIYYDKGNTLNRYVKDISVCLSLVRMKNFLITASLLFCTIVQGQHSFELKEGLRFTEIPFESVSNLIIVPATFNGKETKFILDTGASKSLLFNWNNIDTLEINVKKTLKISGYGEREFLDVYYTDDNLIDVGDSRNTSAEVFVLVDEVIDLEPQLGVFVNGILGADFFKNQVVSIDYQKSVLNIYANISDLPYTLDRFDRFDLALKSEKPYIEATVVNAGSSMTGFFLIDSGSSDALWSFRIDASLTKSLKYFEDYLGFGMNGEIYGKRTKLDKLKIGAFEFGRVATSFPELKKLRTEKLNEAIGSIGGEILRRFTVIFDYESSALYLNEVRGYKDEFYFNLAGINLRLGNNNLFTESIRGNGVGDIQSSYGLVRDQVIIRDYKERIYKYVPELIVSYVRKESPAYQADIRIGDKIIYIEGLKNGSLTINAVNDIFYKKKDKTVNIIVERQNEIIKVKFRQVPLID